MTLANEIRQRARHAIGPMVGAAAVVYFAFHAVHGDRGLMTWMQLRQEIVKAQSEQQEVATERAELDHRVALLRSDGIDPDLLEERAREVLNLGRPGERVILLPPEAKK